MTPLTIYDAVDVAALPEGPAYLAYIDGGYVTYPAVKARFPTAKIYTITVTGRNAADVVDVESQDATPAIAAEGVRRGYYKTIYCNLSTHPEVVAACQGLDWDWWAADPTGYPHIVVGSVATQWAWPGYGSPGNYDISQAISFSPEPAPNLPDLSILEELMKDNEFTVRFLYRFCFHREVDAQGYATWMKFLEDGGTAGQMMAKLEDSGEGTNVIYQERSHLGLAHP